MFAILSTLVVGGGALCCVLPRACGCATLAQATQALTVLPPRTFRVLQNSWVWKTKPKQLPTSPNNNLTAVTKKE